MDLCKKPATEVENVWITYTLGAQPYIFEPYWLISTIWAAHFHFWAFHALSCREFQSCVVVNLIHIFSIFILVSKIFPCGGLLRLSSLIFNLALSLLSKPRRVYRSSMTLSKCIFLIYHIFHFHVFSQSFSPAGGLLRRSTDSEFTFSALKIKETGRP